MARVYNTQQNGEALVSNEEIRLFADMAHTDLQGICENHNKLIIMQNVFLLDLNAFMEYSPPLFVVKMCLLLIPNVEYHLLGLTGHGIGKQQYIYLEP